MAVKCRSLDRKHVHQCYRRVKDRPSQPSWVTFGKAESGESGTHALESMQECGSCQTTLPIVSLHVREKW